MSWALQKDDTKLLERYWLFWSDTGHCSLQSDFRAHEAKGMTKSVLILT